MPIPIAEATGGRWAPSACLEVASTAPARQQVEVDDSERGAPTAIVVQDKEPDAACCRACMADRSDAVDHANTVSTLEGGLKDRPRFESSTDTRERTMVLVLEEMTARSPVAHTGTVVA